MMPVVVGAVLCAAALHATWNAMLRSGADPFWTITVMSIVTMIVGIPMVLVLPLPLPASWPYLGLSSVLQTCYCLFLVRAYGHGEFSEVYPIARGSSPLLVTIGGAVLAGDQLSTAAWFGVFLVSLGILSMAHAHRHARAVGSALVTGLFIASYTITDGMGARLAGNSYAYSAWIFVLYGILMVLAFLAARRRLVIPLGSPATIKATGGGVLSLLTYGIVIWAMTQSPMGPVSALRETSIAFAALIGRMFLGETLTWRRLGACVVIAAGAICLSYRL
ncbi:MAG: EamA family transporter [Gammaproteobacteria bacterium]|nr:EamA family transporter [Gammaproteobacteria bacterium]